jgi:archaellum biogenesis ATPase FlaH
VCVVISQIEIKDEALYLILSSAARLRDANIELIRTLLARDYYVLVVSANQPYEILKKSYERNGIPMEKIFVVDTVTKYAMGQDHEPVPNCRFVSNPSDLTGLGIAITDLLSSNKDKKISLLFDSINAMLIYISSQNITRFIHFVTNKLRLMNFSGIFLAVEKGLDPDLLIQLTTFVDQVVDVDAEGVRGGEPKQSS